MKNETKIPTQEIEAKIGYTFKNKDLLEQAFTRSTYTDEHYECVDNEVLEFIGDSILGMVIVKHLVTRYKSINLSNESEYMLKKIIKNIEGDEEYPYLFKKYFKCVLNEAELSSLKIEFAQRSSLASATEKIGVETYLRMGKNDIANKAEQQLSVKEDLFEAIVGAIAIDSNWNMEILETVIEKLIDFDYRFENGIGDKKDYEKYLNKWFSKKGQVLEFKKDQQECENLEHRYHVDLGMDMLYHTAYGYGKTEKEAIRMAAKNAVEFIEKINDKATIIINAVGYPKLERSVNQLQELYQKGIIPQPEYTFIEHGKSGTGNPEWECWCKIGELFYDEGGYVCATKNEAKKYIAFEALNFLIGRDLQTFIFENGEIISEEVVKDERN